MPDQLPGAAKEYTRVVLNNGAIIDLDIGEVEEVRLSLHQYHNPGRTRWLGRPIKAMS